MLLFFSHLLRMARHPEGEALNTLGGTWMLPVIFPPLTFKEARSTDGVLHPSSPLTLSGRLLAQNSALQASKSSSHQPNKVGDAHWPVY